MLPAQNMFSVVLVVVASYIYWEASVPPTPPASSEETRRPLPRVRLIALIFSTGIVCSLLLTAYRLSFGETEAMKAICSADALQASTHLSYMAVVGLLLIILGGGFRAHSQRTLGKYFTWEVSLKEDHKLCTIGPYSIVRHPGYLGLWVMRVGLNVYQSAGGSVVAECIRPRYPLVVGFFLWVNYLTTPALIVWMYRRAALEDELMEKEFGVVWRKWAEKTPYRIVPYIY